MKVTVHLDDEDYIQYNIYHMFHSKVGQKAILMGKLLGPAISVLVLAVMLIAGADKYLLIVEAVFLSIFSVVTFFTYPSYVTKKLRKQILKMKEEGALPYVKDSTLEFGKDEILEILPNGERHTPYSGIMSVEENGEYIYLRKGAQEVLIVPEKALPVPRDTFVSFMRQKVSGTEQPNV